MFKRKEKVIDKVVESTTKSNLNEILAILGTKREIIIRNLIAGIFRGIGMAIGFTILGAIIIYILQQVFKSNIPVIGEYLADIAEIMEKNKNK